MTDQPQRWTKATVYPDMWVNPDDDPRDTDKNAPDGELPTLLHYLKSYRLTILMKCDGLTAEQMATRSVPPSDLSLLGLIRHLAEVERDWRNWILPGEEEPHIYGGPDADFDDVKPEQAMVDEAFANLEREQAATDAILSGYDDLGVKPGKGEIAIRDLQVHRIEEYARHAGHADLLRECIDGRVGQ
ncbi:MAG: DinB family protein [Thermomicrobiales bacterium]|nr:DinB family protein [Thermomicrobiales bacterium]